LRESVALVWQQRCIGGDDADDRAGILTECRSRNTIADELPDRNALDAEPFAAPVVRLDEDADGVVPDQP
jgi:hypothetical protein